MQRSLFILAAITLIVGATALLWNPATAPLPGTNSTGLHEADQSAVSPLQGGPVESATATPTAPPTDERVEVADTGAEPAGLTVWVHFDHPAGAPAADVKVLFCELSKLFPKSGPRRHWSEFLATNGKTRRTDRAGRVVLPEVRGSLVVAAETKGRYGARLIPRGRHDEHLVLLVDETLTVHVVDDAGESTMGMPVTVYQQFASKRWQHRLNLECDRAGRAIEPHFHLVRKREPKGGLTQFCTAVPVPFATPVLQTFTNNPLAEEPIELRLPATGSLIVRIVDANGVALPSAAEITVSLPRETPPHPALARDFDRLVLHKEQGETAVRFPWVGTGLELRIRIELDDDDFTWQAPLTLGPVNRGEECEVDVPLPEWMGLLSGRLIDPEGQPHADQGATFLITDRTGRIEGEPLLTGTDGRFVLPFRVRQPRPPLTLEVRTEYGGSPAGTVHALRSLDSGATELGDLNLQGLDLLASGTVTDDLGRPIEHARIALQRERERRRRNGPAQVEWQDEAFVETKSEADGTFVLFGYAPNGRVRIHAQARDHVDGFSPAIAPGQDLEFVLTRTGQLSGRLRVPDWLPAEALDIRLRPHGVGFARTARPRGRSRLRYDFRRVIPATYDFEIRVRHFPEPVLLITGILVEPGSHRTDPRLNDLDLTTLLYRYEITATDAQGNRIERLNSPLIAKLLRQNGRVEHRGFTWRNGKVEIFSTTPTLEVVQLGTGFRPSTSILGAGRQALVFERLTPPTIVLPQARALCGDRRVRVSLVLMTATGLPEGMRALNQRSGRSRSYSRAQLSKSGGAWLGATDEVQVPLMRDGRYRVVLRLYEDGVRGPTSVAAGTVDVLLTPNRAQRLRATLDQKKIQAAIAVLQKRKKNS